MMSTPGVTEIVKSPHSCSEHIAPGFGTNVSEVFGKSMLVRTQLTEEHHGLATTMATSGIVDEDSLTQMRTRFMEKQKLCDQISAQGYAKKQNLLNASKNKQKAMKPVVIFTQMMNALREHVRSSFSLNIKDMLVFVDLVADTLKKTKVAQLSQIVSSWQEHETISDDDLEVLKMFVFNDNPSIAFNMNAEKAFERARSIKRTELMLLPSIPNIMHITYEDVEILRWFLRDVNEKHELAAFFLRVSGICVRKGCRAPTFITVLHYIESIFKLFVGILNFRNDLANVFHMADTIESYHAVLSSSTEQFSCAVEYASVLGLPLSSEFYYYESHWKSYILSETAFDMVDCVHTGTNPEQLWILHWAGFNDANELKANAAIIDDIRAQEPKFRLQKLLEPSTNTTDQYFIDEWAREIDN